MLCTECTALVLKEYYELHVHTCTYTQWFYLRPTIDHLCVVFMESVHLEIIELSDWNAFQNLWFACCISPDLLEPVVSRVSVLRKTLDSLLELVGDLKQNTRQVLLKSHFNQVHYLSVTTDTLVYSEPVHSYLSMFITFSISCVKGGGFTEWNTDNTIISY